MKEDNFKSGKEARDSLIAGFDKVANAVRGTLGAAGYNFLAEHTLPPYAITSNDGVTLARAIVLAEPYENLGANLAKEIANKADRTSADGTTTAITLAQAIIKEAKDLDIQPMQLKRELEECIPLVEQALKEQSKEIDVTDIAQVASISAEDPTIGNMIGEIYSHIGRDGIIFHDSSRDFKDSYTLDKGVHIMDCGLASPYMGDMSPEGQLLSTADIKNPLIIITKEKINSVKQLESIGNIVTSQGKKELVIFADDFEGPAMNDLVLTRIRGGIRTTLLKLPILWKDWWLEDLAKLTGATVIDPALGIYLKDFKASMFGTCGSVVAEKENTFLDGTLDISEWVEELMARGTDDMHLRAARLNKKTAKYHVGALTEQALKYRKDKVVDALGSAYQALHGGVVAGGGVALLNASKTLPDTKGGVIIENALRAPITQIMRNAGIPELEINDLYKKTGNTVGFNAKTMKYGDMYEEGVVDAYNTVLSSFKSAISVAATILTVQVITLLPKMEEQINPFNPYERN